MEWLLEPLKEYKKYREENDLSMSIFVLVMGVILIVGLLLFFFFGGSVVIGISTLTMLIFKNETINFYVATLPIVLGLSYATLFELKKQRRQQT